MTQGPKMVFRKSNVTLVVCSMALSCINHWLCISSWVVINYTDSAWITYKYHWEFTVSLKKIGPINSWVEMLPERSLSFHGYFFCECYVSVLLPKSAHSVYEQSHQWKWSHQKTIYCRMLHFPLLPMLQIETTLPYYVQKFFTGTVSGHWRILWIEHRDIPSICGTFYVDFPWLCFVATGEMLPHFLAMYSRCLWSFFFLYTAFLMKLTVPLKNNAL